MTEPVLLLAAHGPAAWGEVAAHVSARRLVIHANLARDRTVAGMATRALASMPRRFILIGQCIGGVVALEMLRQAPQRVIALALISTTARADTAVEHMRRQSRLNHLRDLAEAGLYPDCNYITRAERWFASMQSLNDARKREAIRAVIGDMPLDAACRQQEALLSRPDLSHVLDRAPKRTIIVAGEEDRLSPPIRSHDAHRRVPWADYKVLPNCGHMPALEAPTLLISALEQVLRYE